MNPWRERLAVAPLGVMFASYYTSMTAALLFASVMSSGSLVAPFIAGLLTSCLLTVTTALTRRAEREVTGPAWREASLALIRGLRTGEPGPDASLDQEVLALIELRTQRLSAGRSTQWIVGAIAVALLAGAIAIRDGALVVAATVFAVVAALVVWTALVRDPARLTRLEDALRGRSAAQDEALSRPRRPAGGSA